MFFLSSSSNDAELIRYLFPVGRGPSSKTGPICTPQLLYWTFILGIPQALSTNNFKFCILAGAHKLGQPVPESNFVSESKLLKYLSQTSNGTGRKNVFTVLGSVIMSSLILQALCSSEVSFSFRTFLSC